MHDICDYNDVIPESFRKKLNLQQNKVTLSQEFDKNGRITQPYIFVVGLGEKHFKNFNVQIKELTDEFPWIKKRHIRFILNELIANTQFSMLRQVVQKVPENLKVPAYFYVIIYACKEFFSASIIEYGDYFDYYGLLENGVIDGNNIPEKVEHEFDNIEQEKFNDLNALSGNKIKLVLTLDDEIVVPDISNKIGLNVIENATDNDFYITSFYKKGEYKWKRIYFRIENDQ